MRPVRVGGRGGGPPGPQRLARHHATTTTLEERERAAAARQLDAAARRPVIAAQAAIQRVPRRCWRRTTCRSLGDYERVTAQVIGAAPSNVDQIVEINRGRDDGLARRHARGQRAPAWSARSPPRCRRTGPRDARSPTPASTVAGEGRAAAETPTLDHHDHDHRPTLASGTVGATRRRDAAGFRSPSRTTATTRPAPAATDDRRRRRPTTTTTLGATRPRETGAARRARRPTTAEGRAASPTPRLFGRVAGATSCSPPAGAPAGPAGHPVGTRRQRDAALAGRGADRSRSQPLADLDRLQLRRRHAVPAARPRPRRPGDG